MEPGGGRRVLPPGGSPFSILEADRMNGTGSA